MLRYATIVVCCCLLAVQATEEKPRIIIVGSGPAGIAAGARLLENGFSNVTILEAENRIGGRLFTTEFCGYPVDLGGQWVHGEEGNALFEMVWPLGLLERSSGLAFKTYSSSGGKLPEETSNQLMKYIMNYTEADIPDEYLNGTSGDWHVHKLDEYFKEHPEILTEQREPLKRMFCLMEMALDAADSWYNVVAQDDYIVANGDQNVNWKDKTYGFVIDILLKKYPNPAEEIPFRNQTVLNSEVTRINYNNTDGLVRVSTGNGDEYTAEHVIFTPSLGVLKSDHEKLFNPPLPTEKVNAINAIGFGSVAKIYLFYEEQWWANNGNEVFGVTFFWTDEDRNELVKDETKSWLLGLYAAFTVEHKPGLLCCWVTGSHAREMEAIPDESVFVTTNEVLHRFLDKHYNLTEPAAMMRTQWYTNKHFRGTYSYTSPETVRSGAKAAHLAEPIIENEIPRILFAGEATSTHQAATVHGAASTGWREADRLIKLYKPA